ncbi:MAG TPA: LytTR family DNA-binding domain-containing protein [Blastocatellia bacterium]|nr:LytTR family DNA-binding domain-containing protein [Blastocatellia bacterium]
MTKIRTLIVDDERPARLKIRRFLEREPDLAILPDAASGIEAVDRISRDRPDLVFLDVQMPGLDGFGVLEALDFHPLPRVVFVTAHDEFALKAFEVHALDYLLKPFDGARFKRTIDHARRDIKVDVSPVDRAFDDRLKRLLDEVQSRQKFTSRLLVTSGDRALFVPVERIDWIEAARNYIRLHVGDKTYEIRGTIDGLQRKLDPSKFLRVNRSSIVNLDSVKELRPWFHGEFKILLKDGTELSWSRRFIDRASDFAIGKS